MHVTDDRSLLDRGPGLPEPIRPLLLLHTFAGASGNQDSVEVVESSGHPDFDDAAVAGAKELRFQPARKEGKRIEVWAQVPVHFSKRPRPDTVGRS